MTAIDRTMTRSTRLVGLPRRAAALLASELVVALGAVAGGIGLVINGLGMPRDVLEGTPFSSYLIPGLILALVVGGSMLVAAWMVWTRSDLAPGASLVAGVILLGWIVVQVALIGLVSWLQPTFFGLALVTVALAWRLRQQGVTA